MTYAESTRSAVVYSSIVPPPRTPVAPSMLKDGVRKGSAPQPLQPKNGTNSLDFWSKSEDEKSGITCYYSRHNIQFPSQKQINRMKQVPGRPTMNGFPSTSAAQNGNGVSRYPPFPQNTPESVMSPPVGIYRNVPAMPRAKLSKDEKNGKTRTEENGNSKNVVWGGASKRDDDVGNASAITPLNPYSGNASVEKKRSTARRKPRWTRCFQTLFCCVTPPREIEKIQSNQRTNSTNNNHQNGRPSTPTNNAGPPIQLITQVHRDGTVTGLPQTGQNGQPIGPSGDGVTTYDKVANDSIGSINEKPLLPPLLPHDSKKKCLVIDLDETLVHSSFKPVKNPDFVIPVEIDGVEHQVYVLKRPYVDEFLARVGEHFECILFTASLAKYADPVADLLDKKKVFRGRLFREACVFHKGNYVKDLSRLGRNLEQCLIIDNSPASYAFHPENAVPVTTWFDDPADTELLDILPTLEHLNGYTSIYHMYQPEEGPQSELLNHCSC